MSILNEVVANISDILIYDSFDEKNGRILGVKVNSNINSTSSNTGGLTTGNLLSTTNSVGFGLGNAFIGNSLTVTGDAFLVGNVSANGNLTSNGSSFTAAGNAVFGNSTTPANVVYPVYGTANPLTTSNGIFTVSSPTSSTTIGAGGITTGGNLNLFGGRAVVLQGDSIDTSVTTIDFNMSNYNSVAFPISYVITFANQGAKLPSSISVPSGVYILASQWATGLQTALNANTTITNNWTVSIVSSDNENAIVRLTELVRSSSSNNATATIAYSYPIFGDFVLNVTPAIIFNAGTAMYLGKNTSTTPLITINGSNSTSADMSILTRGSNSWSIGRDNSSAGGNVAITSTLNGKINKNLIVVPGSGQVVVNTSSATTTISSINSGNIGYNSTGGFHAFNGITTGTRAALIYDGWYTGNYAVPNNYTATFQVIQTQQSATLAQMGLSTSNNTGYWTNSSGGPAWYYVTTSVPVFGSSSGIRRLLISRNGDGDVLGCTEQGPQNANTIVLSTSAAVYVGAGESFGVYLYQNAGTNQVYIPADNRTPICVTVVRI